VTATSGGLQSPAALTIRTSPLAELTHAMMTPDWARATEPATIHTHNMKTTVTGAKILGFMRLSH
jgi:hypothetical protein